VSNFSSPVLVGVDGLRGRAGAVRYAIAEARRRQAPLALVHVIPNFFSLARPATLAELDEIGAEILERERAFVRDVAPDLSVTAVAAHGERSTGIVRAAQSAQLVVVGRETRHGVERFLTGTATAAVAAHAPCDVVVVPSDWTDDPRHRVVVGLKSRRHCTELLAHAFSEAAARDAELVVVMAWELADPYCDRVELSTNAAEWEAKGREVVAEVAADWRTVYPNVAIETRVVHGPPAKVLLRASAGSDLLIVSRRRLALPPYGRLGDVVHALLRLSEVPVHVVPYAADPPTEDQEALPRSRRGVAHVSGSGLLQTAGVDDALLHGAHQD
jgi:nucleotide-binding universal stress UspA family protein